MIRITGTSDSRRSAYVKDEIRIAQMYKRPIYPVWVAGDEWMDSENGGEGNEDQADEAAGNGTVHTVDRADVDVKFTSGAIRRRSWRRCSTSSG